MSEQEFEKCKKKVRELYVKGTSPSEIRNVFEDIYSPEALTTALNQVMAELADEVYWDDPTTVDGRTHKWNWYKGPAEDAKRWNYFLKGLSDQGHIGEETLADLDKSTSRILNLNPNPKGHGYFKSRGLVMGHVQSGKTTNFLGLATKAADEGYRLIIVLSGVTNNLRAQTQERLEASIDKAQWYLLTDMDHDFQAGKANAQVLLANTSNRHVAVVKKNKARLVSLYKWLNTASEITRQALPVLIIDDECDQATVNAGTQEKRNAINKALHDIIDPKFLPKNSYVGYSATPFANILADTTDENGIYPKDFVVSLQASPGYFGADRLFGTEIREDEGSATNDADIIRNIPNNEVLLISPPKKKAEAENWVPTIPKSLDDAIRWFVLATAMRWARGDSNKWSSMMIHNSSNIKPHEKTAEAIRSHIKDISIQLNSTKGAGVFKKLWEEESDRAKNLEANLMTDWNLVEPNLGAVLNALKVITDNSKSPDRLNYSPDIPPYPVVVVGGNTLARGLTLNGLVSSYFLRSSNAYDSLMQMGRWFGYRPGYADLQRIWMSNEKPYRTSFWFRELSLVEEEIRQQIELYAREGRSPSELGIRIKSLPGMAITAAAKMKSAMTAQIGFGRSRQQTILFKSEAEAQLNNQFAAKVLINKIGAKKFELNEDGWRVAKDLSSQTIKDFLTSYDMHPNARTLDSGLINDYIDNLNSEGELAKWNVAFYSNKKQSAKQFDFGDGFSVRMATRSRMKDEENINIKTLISLGDMVADKPGLKTKAKVDSKGGASKVTEAGLHFQRATDPETAGRGLLGIYVIDKDSMPANTESQFREGLGAHHDLVGFFLVFPGTESKFNVTYVAPNLSVQEVEFETIDDDPYEEDSEDD